MYPRHSPTDEALLTTLLGRLKLFFTSLDVSQSEVARRVDYSQSNISNWFNKKKEQEPRLLPIVKIAQAFGMNLNWLMSGEGSMFAPTHGQPGAVVGVRGGLDAIAQVDQAVREIRRALEAELSRAEASGAGGIPLSRADEGLAVARSGRPRQGAGRRSARG